MDTNGTGSALLEYLATTDLEILTRGNTATFETVNRMGVLALTFCSRAM